VWLERIPTEDVERRFDTASGIPPTGLVITPRELRDLIA